MNDWIIKFFYHTGEDEDGDLDDELMFTILFHQMPLPRKGDSICLPLSTKFDAEFHESKSLFISEVHFIVQTRVVWISVKNRRKKE